MFRVLGTTLISVGLMSGCALFGVTGSGPVQAEPRSVAAFTRIEASHGIRVDVSFGPTQAVEVRAQANVLPLISTTSEAGTLRIAVTSPISTSTQTVVAVVVPSLESIILSGGSVATVSGFAASNFVATISGGAQLHANGAVETVTIVASGGAGAHLRDLAVVTMIVDASGGALVEAQVSGEVRGSASGGARVSITGDAVLNVEASGGANVERVP